MTSECGENKKVTHEAIAKSANVKENAGKIKSVFVIRAAL